MLYLFKWSTEIIQVTEGRILVSPILTHKGHLRIKVKLNNTLYSGVWWSRNIIPLILSLGTSFW